MKYIAYLDLLGTKGLCEDEELYYKSITKFADTVKTLSPILDQKGRIGIFSDCVYVECSHIDELLRFLTKLRIMLIGDNLFFNAAVAKGKLGVEPINEQTNNNIFGVKFTNKEIASIYCKQTKFRGIGISIDENLIGLIKESNKYSVVQSVFYSKKEKNNATLYKAQRYWDVPLFNSEENDNDLYNNDRIKVMLSIIIKNLYTSHCKSQNYSVYYVSLLINVIRCCDLKTLKWNQSTIDFENASIEFNIIYKFLVESNRSLTNLVGLDSICFSLLDVLYNLESITEYDKAEITKKFMNTFKCLEKYKYSMNSVPYAPFTEDNQKKFINFCNSDMARQFIDNII